MKSFYSYKYKRIFSDYIERLVIGRWRNYALLNSSENTHSYYQVQKVFVFYAVDEILLPKKVNNNVSIYQSAECQEIRSLTTV